jgi:hypothetical protein
MSDISPGVWKGERLEVTRRPFKCVLIADSALLHVHPPLTTPGLMSDLSSLSTAVE